MIVVMPMGHTNGPLLGMGAPPAPINAPDSGTDDFTQDFNLALRPYIEKHYRVKTGRENRAIAGLSMGGSQTLNIAIPNLNDYAYVGVFSSGVLGGGGRGRGAAPAATPAPPFGEAWEKRHLAMLDNAAAKKGLKLFWLSTGKDDFLIETSRSTVKLLERHGFTPKSRRERGRPHLAELARLPVAVRAVAVSVTDTRATPNMPKHPDMHRLAAIPQIFAVSACPVTRPLSHTPAANPERAQSRRLPRLRHRHPPNLEHPLPAGPVDREVAGAWARSSLRARPKVWTFIQSPPPATTSRAKTFPTARWRSSSTIRRPSGFGGCCASTRPRATPPLASIPCSISTTAWATPAPNGRSGRARRSSSTTCSPRKSGTVHHRLPQRECHRDACRREAGRPYPGVLRDSLPRGPREGDHPLR